MHRALAYVVLLLAETIGGASLLIFLVFLFAGPWVAVRLGLSDGATLYWDALLSMLFFAQHSVMVRRRFKDGVARWIPRDYHGAVYGLASGIVLMLSMVLWQPSSYVVADLTGFLAWLLRGGSALAIVGFAWGIRSLRTFDTFGRIPVVARLRGQTVPAPELIIRGAYEWMRHPLMFFMIVLMWTNPVLTADRLLFNVLWTAWLVVGSFFEERDLIAEFGADYRAYQRIVPMLLPWRGPVGRRLRRSAPAIGRQAAARSGAPG